MAAEVPESLRGGGAQLLNIGQWQAPVLAQCGRRTAVTGGLSSAQPRRQARPTVVASRAAESAQHRSATPELFK